jgi:ribose-phosphate pyrophosphokinase
MVDAARRAGAKGISLYTPYFPYSRQDRKDKPRSPISASLMANIFEMRSRKNCTFDLHAEQEVGFFKGPWDNLYGSTVILPQIEE